MTRSARLSAACVAALLTAAGAARAQTTPPPAAPAAAPAPAAPAAPSLLGPAMTPPLSLNANPISVDGGPLGKLYVSGQLTGLGLAQSDTVPFPGSGNADSLLDVSNAQVEIQAVSGPFQFFIQAGSYTFPTLGTPYVKPGKNLDLFFGAVPVAYGKFVVNDKLSIQAGAMPTLIGSEYAFTYQNLNIERGLAWNQEPVISKGVQVNFASGPLTVQASINDGFYSDHYNWFSGLVSYAIDSANTIAVNGGVNFSHTFTNKFRAPNAQNNSAIFDVAYTYNKGPIYINPYFQYTKVDGDLAYGVQKGASTWSLALLGKYTVNPQITLAARAEYISSDSDACTAADGEFCAPTSLLYGPGSDAWSLTFTPTWQKGILFARAEVSYTKLESFTPGFGFGPDFSSDDQVRGLIEAGVLF